MIVDLTASPPPEQWGVFVNGNGIGALASEWAEVDMPLPRFDYPGTPAERDAGWWYNYVTLSVSVLACLWPPDGERMWSTEHEGTYLDDAPAIFASFTRLVRSNGVDLEYLVALDDDSGPTIFAGRGCLQLLPERVDTLRRVASTLLDRWDGNAANLVAEGEHDGVRIANLLTETMPGFLDRPQTDVGVLPFDKLSYLATSVMTAGMGWNFSNCEDFPVYPDYMLPRVFRHFDVLRYDTDVADAVDNQRLIPALSPAENGIRWATVYAGARLREALAERGNEVSGPGLDYKLWSEAVLGDQAADFGEHHRTLTMRY